MKDYQACLKICLFTVLALSVQAQSSSSPPAILPDVVIAEIFSTHINIEIMVFHNWYTTKAFDLSGFQIQHTA